MIAACSLSAEGSGGARGGCVDEERGGKAAEDGGGGSFAEELAEVDCFPEAETDFVELVTSASIRLSLCICLRN